MIRKHRHRRWSPIFLSIAVAISAVAIGFGAWSAPGSGDSVEATVTVSADEAQFAGFQNLTSNKTLRFDAPTSDTSGRVIYTNDVGGEQLTIDVSGTVLNYSQVGSISIAGSFDDNHISTYNKLVNLKYIVPPTFEELTRKATVANPTANGSYWVSDHNTTSNTRDFRIIASFGWGSFFNYKNPSVFFDSSDSNIEKMGKEYSIDSIKSILATIRQISNSTYNVNLSPEALTYTINYLSSTKPNITSLPESVVLTAGEEFTIPSTALSATGYDFKGYSLTKDSSTAQYLAGETHNIDEFIALDSTVNVFNLYTVFTPKSFTLTISIGKNESAKYTIKRGSSTIANEVNISASGTASPTVQTGDTITLTVSPSSNYTAGSITKNNGLDGSGPYTVNGSTAPTLTVASATKNSSGCVLPDTLVTMADGSKRPIKDIVAGDEVLAFNHETGELVTAPVVFNEKEEYAWQDVIYLEFSNSSTIGVISEHGFFDLDTMCYEYIDVGNYRNFVGHRFYAVDANMDNYIVTLNKAYIVREYVECYELPSFYHLDFFTEEILSMPGGIKGLFNIFEYGDNLQYEPEAYARDIETYGLFTHEDLAPLGITEIMFEAYAGKYLKVALGKGILTEEYLAYLIERYGGFTD